MSAVRLAVAGAGGRMGRALLEAGSADPATAIAAALDVAGSPFAGHDAGELAAGAKGVAVGTDPAAAFAAADVLIDFTRPAGTLAHLAAGVAAGKPLVIGTTGFEPPQLAKIREAAGKVPVVFAPNFAIGVLVMMKLVDMASRALGPAYDVEVFELHHKLKVDAPSGTALKLGEVAAAARGTSLAQDGVYARHGVTGERIEITHRSASRATYAQGAIRAAKWVVGKPPGLYDMEDVLGLRG